MGVDIVAGASEGEAAMAAVVRVAREGVGLTGVRLRGTLADDEEAGGGGGGFSRALRNRRTWNGFLSMPIIVQS